MYSIICKIFGHNWKYHVKLIPTCRICNICGEAQEAFKNPNFKNILKDDYLIWKVKK